MKTLAKLLYVEADEEITDLVDRLRDLSLEDEVTFVVPERARALESPMSFRLLKRYADSYGKRVNLVSGDPRLQAMSLEAGFAAFPSLAAYDRGSEVHNPQPAGEPASTPAATAAAPALAVSAPPTSPRAVAPQHGVATLDRPRETSVTSAPPRPVPSARKPAPSGPPLGSYRPYLIGAAVLVVVGLLVGILYLPTATATVSVQGTAIRADMALLGAPGTATGSPDHFATLAVHASQSQTFPGTPTGQNPVAAVKASGQVVFTVYCAGPFCPTGTVPVRAGTDVSTNDGKHYLTQRTVNVPAPNGSMSVAITAVQAGAGANTDRHTIRNIGDNQNDFLSVDNTDALTNGADARTATVIQQSDIDSIRDVYAKDAVPQVTDQLTGKAQGQKLVLVGSGVQAAATADHKVGEEVNGFTITIKVAGDGVAFDEKAVQAMLKGFLQRKVPQGSQLTNNGTTLKYDPPTDATVDGHVTLNGHVSGFYTPIFLEPAIRSHLKGMSPTKGRAFLQSLQNVVDARVTQSPFGLPWLPFFSSRITLKIQEVSSNSASP